MAGFLLPLFNWFCWTSTSHQDANLCICNNRELNKSPSFIPQSVWKLQSSHILKHERKMLSICSNTHTVVCVPLHNAFVLLNHLRKAQKYISHRSHLHKYSRHACLNSGEKGTTYHAFVVKSCENRFCQFV